MSLTAPVLQEPAAHRAGPRAEALVRGEPFALSSCGGAMLAATRYRADVPAGELPAVVVAAATGVPQRFYRPLAQWLAARGHAVYTFDYRGTAASRPSRLRGYAADFSHWAADIDSVLAHALGRHARVSLLGHSSGGFLAPAAPHAAQLHRLVMVGAQTADWRDWPPLQRLPMLLLWHGLLPLVTLATGYFPGRLLHLGEDLPRGVALQWASRPWRDPFRRAEMAAGYARALPPVYLAAASDDPFATPAALQRMQERLAQATVLRHVVAPADAGLPRLGHFAILRPEAAAWWPRLLGWLRGDAADTATPINPRGDPNP